MVKAQSWWKHSRKSPKLSGSLITELRLCGALARALVKEGQGQGAQHMWKLEGVGQGRGKLGLEPGGWGTDLLLGDGGLVSHLWPGDFSVSHGTYVSRLNLTSRHILFSSCF